MATRLHIPQQSHISSYVTAVFEAKGRAVGSETILPQGYAEMIFNLGDPMLSVMPHAQTAELTPIMFLQGWNSQTVQVTYTGKQHLFGVRLHTHMVRSLLGLQPGESSNTLIDLSLIDPKFLSLWHALKEAASFATRIQVVETMLPIINDNPCERTRNFCEYIQSDTVHAAASVDALSAQICYSSRQLNRKAQALFGASAEELMVYKKFRNAIHLMHGEKRSLTDIAYEAGFYDQAHFCRIFKNYSGITAKQYQQQKTELPFHLFG